MKRAILVTMLAMFKVASAAPTDASEMTVESTGSDTPRSLKERFAETLNVKDWGAKGDGTADDTSAFQRVIAVAKPNGSTRRKIYIPPGTYVIKATLLVDNASVQVSGAGRQMTNILCRPTAPKADCIAFVWPGPSYAHHNTLQGMTIDGSAPNVRYVVNTQNQASFFADDLYAFGGTAALRLRYDMMSQFQRSMFRGASLAGVYSDDDSAPTTSTSFVDCDLSNNKGDGYRGGNAQLRFEGSVFQANAGYAIRLGAGTDYNGNVRLVNNHFEHNALGDIYAGDTYYGGIPAGIYSFGNAYIGKPTEPKPSFAWDLGNVAAVSDGDYVIYPTSTRLFRVNRQRPKATTTRRLHFGSDPNPENTFTTQTVQDDAPGGWSNAVSGYRGSWIDRYNGITARALPPPLQAVAPNLHDGGVVEIRSMGTADQRVSAPIGNPVVGQRLTFIIHNESGAHNVAWDSIYETTWSDSGNDIAGTRAVVSFIYAANGRWLQTSYKSYLDMNPLRAAPPTAGTWKTGDIVRNSAPRPAGPIGWICTAGGSPGSWAAIGRVDAAGAQPPLATAAAWDVSGGRTVRPYSGLGVAKLEVTDRASFTIANPEGATNDGQVLVIRVKNVSGGSLGTITWGDAYRLAPWTSPPHGFARAITFMYDAATAAYSEIGRSGDVP